MIHDSYDDDFSKNNYICVGTRLYLDSQGLGLWQVFVCICIQISVCLKTGFTGMDDMFVSTPTAECEYKSLLSKALGFWLWL